MNIILWPHREGVPENDTPSLYSIGFATDTLPNKFVIVPLPKKQQSSMPCMVNLFRLRIPSPLKKSMYIF